MTFSCVYVCGFPGAALGRLVGEGAVYLFSWTSINPGGYALAGRKTKYLYDVNR